MAVFYECVWEKDALDRTGGSSAVQLVSTFLVYLPYWMFVAIRCIVCACSLF